MTHKRYISSANEIHYYVRFYMFGYIYVFFSLMSTLQQLWLSIIYKREHLYDDTDVFKCTAIFT